MKQKHIWTRYISLGSFFIALYSMMAGCTVEKNDYPRNARWIYINETGYSISYIPNNWLTAKLIINPNDTIVYEEQGEGGKNAKASDYMPPLKPDTIVYDSFLCYSFDLSKKLAKGEYPGNIDNYEAIKLNDNYYQFTYKFTKVFALKADTCK
jgi:hypothetical protein